MAETLIHISPSYRQCHSTFWWKRCR